MDNTEPPMVDEPQGFWKFLGPLRLLALKAGLLFVLQFSLGFMGYALAKTWEEAKAEYLAVLSATAFATVGTIAVGLTALWIAHLRRERDAAIARASWLDDQQEHRMADALDHAPTAEVCGATISEMLAKVGDSFDGGVLYSTLKTRIMMVGSDCWAGSDNANKLTSFCIHTLFDAGMIEHEQYAEGNGYTFTQKGRRFWCKRLKTSARA